MKIKNDNSFHAPFSTSLRPVDVRWHLKIGQSHRTKWNLVRRLGRAACASVSSDAAILSNLGSGTVYKGIWNKTPVALKLLITENGVTPSSEVRQYWYSTTDTDEIDGFAVHPQRN